MKIFVEGSALLKERSGVGQFAKRLIEAYCPKYPQDQITIFGFRFFTKQFGEPIKRRPNLSYKVTRWLPGRVYNMLFRLGVGLPVDLLLLKRPDVIIYPNFIRWPVLNRKTKTVVMIHDLSFVYFPQFANPINLSDNTRFVPRSIAKADHIITISENSRSQIINHFKVSTDKISIVYPAVDTKFFYRRGADEIKKIRGKYSLPDKYIFFTSTIEPRKNVEGLLKAYERLPEPTRSRYALVLAGGKGWQNESILDHAEKLRANGLSIILTGYVPDEDLPALYSGASAFVFPTHYEGFGIPILEAMACGVPVISADNSSLPEVAGGATVLVKAEDIEGLSKKIQKLLDDKTLQDQLIQKGYEQIKKFTWERSAQQLNEALEKLE